MNKKIILTILVTFFMIGCGTYSLQTKTKMTRTIFFDHSQKVNKNIYLQVSSTSGSSSNKMKLEDKIKSHLVQKGYKIVNSSSNAGYSLFVNILFAGDTKEALALKSALSSGVIGGTGAIASGAGGKNSLLTGLAFAIGGATVGSALEDETFKAIVDIKIDDYDIKREVTQKETRILSEAVQMNLDKKEAIEKLEDDISIQIANIF